MLKPIVQVTTKTERKYTVELDDEELGKIIIDWLLMQPGFRDEHSSAVATALSHNGKVDFITSQDFLTGAIVKWSYTE